LVVYCEVPTYYATISKSTAGPNLIKL